MSENNGTVLFISHASAQAAIARQLKARLEAAGINGWMAPDDIEPGISFDQAIIAQVARCDGIVLLLSSDSDQSRHVKRELILGEDKGRPIYPVRVEDMTPQGLAYWLQDYQWIDWFGGKGPGADRLIETLRRNAGAAPGETAPPAAAAITPWRRRGVALAAGALLLLVAGIAAWVLLGRGAAPAPADFVINPGKWIARRDVTEIVYPRVDPERARQMEQQLETDPNPEECIAPEVARAPDVRLFDPRGEGGCRLTSFVMSGGQMSGYLSCPLRDAPGGQGVMQVTFRGRYTRTLIEIDNDITVSLPGSTVRVRARDTTRYSGPTCSPQAPQPVPAANAQ
jgi:hypothetical protein